MRISFTCLAAVVALTVSVPLAVQGVQSSGGQTASTTNWDSGSVTAWDYVGSIYDASGVYLGNYGGDHWVLTAAHVGTGPFRLGGHTYSVVADSRVMLNPVGDATNPPDLVLFRINGGNATAQAHLDALAILELSDTPLAIATDVRLVGHGDDNGSAVIKTWGDNAIAGAGTLTFTAKGNTYTSSNYYTLDSNGVRAVVGDSGGGAFYWTGDSWALGGIMSAIVDFQGDVGKGVAIVAIDDYMDQVMGIIPEPGALALVSGALALGSVLVARRRQRI